MGCSPCATAPSINGQAAGGGAPVEPVVGVLWEADLADQGDVVFADGPQGITGLDGTVLTGTIANTDRAVSGTVADWGFEQGVGMNWLASVTSGTWTAALQTASRWVFPTATLLTTFDLDFTARIIVELYFTVATLSAGNPDISIGFSGLSGAPANSGDRMFATKRGLRAAVQVSLTETTAASSNYTTAPGPTADVVATMMQGNAFTGLIGNATAGPPFVWPRLRTIVSAGSPAATSLSTLTGTNLAIAFGSASVAGTSRFRANRIRIRSAA